MIQIISDNEQFAKLFEESMDAYRYYDWAVAWVGQPKRLMEKLAQNKNKIRCIVSGLYGLNKEPITSLRFVKEYKDLKDENGNPKVVFIKKEKKKAKNPHFILHSKLYYFENSDTDWRLFVGSANFTKPGFSSVVGEANVETMLVCDQDSYSNVQVKEFFEKIRLPYYDEETNWGYRPYTEEELIEYIEKLEDNGTDIQ